MTFAVLFLVQGVSAELPPEAESMIEQLSAYEQKILRQAHAQISLKRELVVEALEEMATEQAVKGDAEGEVALREAIETLSNEDASTPTSAASNESQKTEIMLLAKSDSLSGDRTELEVPASSGPRNPMSSGVRVSKDEEFAIYPDPDGKWGGGGTKTGKFCDYRGYPGKESGWMRMECRVGKEGTPLIIDPIRWMKAEQDGVIYVYAQDLGPKGNPGSIRVTIVRR